MFKSIFIIFISIILALILISCTRIIEIYKPLTLKQIQWSEIYDLKKLDKNYVAQGIEVYKNYLFFTAHKQDKASVLIVFNITDNSKLKPIFTTYFPKEATHVSDLSIYNSKLYTIDYATNNLYVIDINKTIQNQKLSLIKTIPTYLSRSGSIILTNYNNTTIVMISQFIINDKIKAYKLSELSNKYKKPLFAIDAKYFIQGLYAKDNKLLVSSNKKGTDLICITNLNIAIKDKTINNKSSIYIKGPRRMIEDIVLYKNYIITSDEKTNKIYISNHKLSYIYRINSE